MSDSLRGGSSLAWNLRSRPPGNNGNKKWLCRPSAKMRLRREGCPWPFSLSVQPGEAEALDRSSIVATFGEKTSGKLWPKDDFHRCLPWKPSLFRCLFCWTPWFLCRDAAVVTVDSLFSPKRDKPEGEWNGKSRGVGGRIPPLLSLCWKSA